MSALRGASIDLGEFVDRALVDVAKILTGLQVAVRADDKTPLLNGLALRADSSRFGSQDSPNVLVFGDLNRFKSLNDNHGHAAGDAAINQVGRLIETTLVQGCQGQAYRQSGDEFVILLRREALESFRKSVTAFTHCVFQFDGKSLATAMSFGFAIADSSADWFETLKRAEAACAVAKNQGDGVCVEWTPQIQQQALINRRFRCQCGVKFSCDIPPSSTTTTFRCPCCFTEQSDVQTRPTPPEQASNQAPPADAN